MLARKIACRRLPRIAWRVKGFESALELNMLAGVDPISRDYRVPVSVVGHQLERIAPRLRSNVGNDDSA